MSSFLKKDIIYCNTCSCTITSNSIQCSLCQMWVHYECTNLTMKQLVNLDNGVNYKYCLDIFPFHNSNNEFDNPCSNINTNIEANKWHCEGSKLNVNICNNIYENNFCFNNIDPDNNFFDNVSMECYYYTEDRFHQTLNIHQGRSIVHFNCRSLFSNFEEIRAYLSELRFAITLSETWIKKKNWILFNCQIINCIIKNFTQKRWRSNIYIRNCINFQILDNLSCTVENVLECISVEQHIANSKPIIVSCLYRHSDSKIIQTIDIIKFFYKNAKYHLYLCGDFNVNLLNYHHHNGTTDFVDSLVSLNLFPCITKPTRITRHSSTIMDNISTNNIFHRNKSGLLMNDITDHLPIFAFYLHEVKKEMKAKHLSIREKIMNNLSKCLIRN